MKILALTAEPGGAAMLAPLIWGLSARGHQVETWAKGSGAERLRQEGIEALALPPWKGVPGAWLQERAADLLLSSATSLPWVDLSERWAWMAAAGAGIPSIALVDSWQNYNLRFAGSGPGHPFMAFPDLIGCPDALALTEMEAAGLPVPRLRAWGHPGLDHFIQSFRPLGRAGFWMQEPERRDCLHVLFVSEAIAEHFGRERGYDQHDCFRELAGWLELCPEPLNLLIKLHPKESRRGHLAAFRAVPARHRVLTLEDLSPLEAVGLADVVVGMTSVLLVEAHAVGRPVLSLQPGLHGEDHLVLSRHGLVPRLDRMLPPDRLRVTAKPGPDRKPFAWDAFVQDIEVLCSSMEGSSNGPVPPM